MREYKQITYLPGESGSCMAHSICGEVQVCGLHTWDRILLLGGRVTCPSTVELLQSKSIAEERFGGDQGMGSCGQSELGWM